MTNDQLTACIVKARQRIRPYIIKTPLLKAHVLSERYGTNIYLKYENMQITHSFKLRGALNKILGMTLEGRAKGVVAASSGNHGVGVAYAANQLGVATTIVVPEQTPDIKAKAIIACGARLIKHGRDCQVSEQYAAKLAQEYGSTFISPYNDYHVIAGQGTLGLEIKEQCPAVDDVFVSVGGGGLMSGISSYMKTASPNVTLYACQPENDPAMFASIQAGKVIDIKGKPSLSDGTAGNIDPLSVTFPICQRNVDHFILVSEADIAAAMRELLHDELVVAEGAAALTLAAMAKNTAIKGKNIVLLICGGNVDFGALQGVLASIS